MSECPTASNPSVSCLGDNSLCPGGTFTGNYDSITVDSYCLPNDIKNVNIQALFGPDPYQ